MLNSRANQTRVGTYYISPSETEGIISRYCFSQKILVTKYGYTPGLILRRPAQLPALALPQRILCNRRIGRAGSVFDLTGD